MTQEAPPSAVMEAPGIKPELRAEPEKPPSPEDWEVFNALQEDGNPPEKISPNWAIINTASIPAPEINNGRILLSRAIYRPDIRAGEPDRNSIHVCVIDQAGNHQRLKDLNLPLNDKLVNWEDARVGPGQTLGFTVVLRKDGKYSPHPALVKVEVNNEGNLEVVGEPQIFEDLTGKNVVPLENGFIYRPDGVSHKLHYLNQKGELLKIIDFSNFKHIDWLSKKMGAVAKPIDLEDGRKLLLIHGVRKGKGIDGKIKDDVYAIGIAVLDENWQVLAVDNNPLLERKDFIGNLHPKYDLNPKKEVVYLCDFMEEEDSLVLPVNVGDRITVFKHIPKAALNVRVDKMLLSQAA